VIIALGLVAVLAAGGLLAYAHRPVFDPTGSPGWGVYSDAQWHRLQARYGPIEMATSGTTLAIVRAHGCLVVLHGMTRRATVCRPAAPLRVFASRSGRMTDVVGITSPAVSFVTSTGRYSGRPVTSGAFLMPAPHGHVFGFGDSSAATTLTAYDAHGRVLARLYCASALRGVCGSSAHRRS
jgi:hypothetical protein